MENLKQNNYSIIYADPPWYFTNWSPKGGNRSATRHYSCMSMDDIAKLPVSSISAENSILFMWATDPLLPKQIHVMEEWGFNYKTVGFVWTKYNKKTPTPFIGLGYYTRSNQEYCLIGTKGKIGRPKDKSISQVLNSPIREHSRKPDIMYEYIERMYPEGEKIELFARTKRPGWDCWGNETDKFI